VRERRPRPWDGWPLSVKLGVAGTAVVLAACWAVSFDAIVVGARAASIPAVLALLCPVIVDGEMAIGTLALVAVSRHVKARTRVYLGVLILASVAVSMAANMAAPYTRGVPDALPAPWSYLASGVPSLWIALIVHQFLILWRHAIPPPNGGTGTASASEVLTVDEELALAARSQALEAARGLAEMRLALEGARPVPPTPLRKQGTRKPPPPPRSNAAPGTKRELVLLALRGEATTEDGHDVPRDNDSAIARHAGCSRTFVGKVRAELAGARTQEQEAGA